MSKKEIKYELTEKREPFMAHLKTMVGREPREDGANGLSKVRKDKKPGPASYNSERGIKILSTIERVPYTQFSGLGNFVG